MGCLHIRCFLGAAVIFSLAAISLQAAEVSKPRVILIGDSTVKNGSGKGNGGMFGWGQVLADSFDLERITIENRALGGRSSRSYLTEGMWRRSLERLRPGDYVLMQFGHNDGGQRFKGNRPRASIKGNGDETDEGVVEITGKAETVRSFGWYLRKYIKDTKAKGATPIVLSLIPRDRWKNGRVIRSDRDYGKWAQEAAEQSGALFIDLNELVSRRFESLGEATVGKELFTEKDWTHTKLAGAKVCAESVVEGIRRLEDCPLVGFLLQAKLEKSSRKLSWRFDFGEGALSEGYQRVVPLDKYSAQKGFGFEAVANVENVGLQFSDPRSHDGCASDTPFYFSIALPAGNYRVQLTGGVEPLTVKAELRRLMTENRLPSSTNPAQCEFTVNIRSPRLPSGKVVRLKRREETSEKWAWDEKLTLEINGPAPCITSLTIEPEFDALTVYLAGDSTVTDQPLEPWNSWGQMLPRFLKPGVAVANHSESGESIRSFLGARRFEKIFSLIKPDDYLFIQFGHNDMKDKSPDALVTYRANLVKLVQRTKEAKAQPVLVTSMKRKPGPKSLSLGRYPQAVRDVAAELKVPLIDLHKISEQLYQALGDDLDKAFQDGTHHTTYGSYLLAKCVVQEIRDNKLGLAEYIVPEFEGFASEKPDPFDSMKIPPSPVFDLKAPAGN